MAMKLPERAVYYWNYVLENQRDYTPITELSAILLKLGAYELDCGHLDEAERYYSEAAEMDTELKEQALGQIKEIEERRRNAS